MVERLGLVDSKSLVVLHIGSISNNAASGVSAVVPQYLLHQSALPSVRCALLNICEKDSLQFDDDDILVFKNDSLKCLPEPFDAPDIVVFHEIYRLKYCLLVKQIRSKGIPYIVLPHGSLTKEAQSEKGVIKRVLNAFFFNSFVCHAACIHYLSKREASSSVIGNNDYFVLGNGVDRFDIPSCEKKNQILFLGRLDIRVKGLDLLLDAVKEAQQELRLLSYQVVVAGPDEKGSLERLKAKARNDGVADLICFPGAVYGEEKKRLLSESRIYVQLSRTEALPTSVLEAMMYALPVVVTEGTSMLDIVSQHGLGYGVESDPVCIAEAIVKMISNSWLTAEAGKRSREFVEKNYSWNSITQEQVAHYHDVVSKNQ